MKLSALFALALYLLTAVGSLADGELTLDDIFPTDRVLDVQITVADEDWETICHQSRDFISALHESRKFRPIEAPYTYVNASVTIDGIKFPQVGIRKKGFVGSQSTSRPSLKIKLDHIDKKDQIGGLDVLTFNNNLQDRSQVGQFMGYAMFNAAGIPAPRCAYAKVTVNGVSLGIYSHVEAIRKSFLRRAFGNDDGVLYEGPYVDFYPGWEWSLEYKRGNEKRGRKKIKQLVKVLESDDENIEEAIGELVDLDSFYIYWALEGLIGFWDGYSSNSNNFFIYLNPETERFHFIPWGADSVFSGFAEVKPDSKAPISVRTQGLIAYKLYQLESGRERYANTIMSLIENHWNADKLLAEIDRIEAMIKPYLKQSQLVINEKKKKPEHTFARSLKKTRQFIRRRKPDIIQEVANGMPIWEKPPMKPLTIPTSTIKAFSCGCAIGGCVGGAITILMGWIINLLK